MKARQEHRRNSCTSECLRSLDVTRFRKRAWDACSGASVSYFMPTETASPAGMASEVVVGAWD